MPTPLSAARDPFRGAVTPADRPRGNSTMRTPQGRVMRALMPTYPDDPPSEWPLLTRAGLAQRAGYTAISGTVTRALNGIREGSSSGDAHPGVLALGWVEEVQLDIDGLVETNYRATAAGIEAYRAFIEAGGTLPAVKDASVCTNDRYRGDGTAGDKNE